MSELLEQTIHASLTFNGSPSREIKVVFTYDTERPYVITLKFNSADSRTHWSFTRDFLGCGVATNVSECNASMTPHPIDPEFVVLTLEAGVDLWAYTFNLTEVDDFILDTFDLVAFGDELELAVGEIEDFLESVA